MPRLRPPPLQHLWKRFPQQGEHEVSQVSSTPQRFLSFFLKEFSFKIEILCRLMHSPPAPPKKMAGIVTECAVHWIKKYCFFFIFSVLKTCPSELLQVEFSAWLTWAFQLFLLEICFAVSESQQSSCSRLHCQIIELGSLEMLGLGVAKLRRETLKLHYSCSVRCCRKLILFIPVIPRDCLKL